MGFVINILWVKVKINLLISQIVHFNVRDTVFNETFFRWSTTCCNICDVPQPTPHPAFWNLERHIVPIIGRALIGFFIDATRGNASRVPARNSRLYSKYEQPHRPSHDSRPISLSQRITFNVLVIILSYGVCAEPFCCHLLSGKPIPEALARSHQER